MEPPVKRGRGRPKGSSNKNKTKTKNSGIQIKVEQVAIDVDRKVSHLDKQEVIHHQEPRLTELEHHLQAIDDSWETESLFEDILEDLSDETAFENGMIPIYAFDSKDKSSS